MGKYYDRHGNVLAEFYTMPEECGAVGDGVTDDTSAIQTTVNKKGLIVFATGKTYKITSTIRLKKDTVVDFNGATLVCTDYHSFFNFVSTDTFTGYNGNGNITIRNGTIIGGGISFGHANGVRLENLTFVDCLNDHWLEIAGCKNYVIEGCVFGGIKEQSASRNIVEYINFDACYRAPFPHLPNGSAFYDGTKNNNVVVNNCKFAPGEGTYGFAYVAIGTHGINEPLDTAHEKTVFTNNEVIGFATYGIHIANMNNVYIANNRIYTVGDCVKIGDLNPPTSDNITIVHNHLVSQNGEMVSATQGGYTNLVVEGNTTESSS